MAETKTNRLIPIKVSILSKPDPVSGLLYPPSVCFWPVAAGQKLNFVNVRLAANDCDFKWSTQHFVKKPSPSKNAFESTE
jgi:hypothetical protein